jgi:hypothetical protein
MLGCWFYREARVTIADSIAQLSPPQSHGDRVAIEILEQQVHPVAELDA